eukprot:NODE_1470_length_1519_cov_23.998639_g1328_i0.p1 GENE.NODE_1470_length_1519_cov_23.998639_g1328_i0~~NODE_1470_length_1519_cov_23.998639_g1328_i0.p1  ORF type:complete len:434 (-),score=95.74 NODE_1470_length_1519_cov_23.998639_g1328_i0:99-1400(-)
MSVDHGAGGGGAVLEGWLGKQSRTGNPLSRALASHKPFKSRHFRLFSGGRLQYTDAEGGEVKVIETKNSAINSLTGTKFSISCDSITYVLEAQSEADKARWMDALLHATGAIGLSFSDFEFEACIGTGSCGRVYKCTLSRNQKAYALKVIDKQSLLLAKDVEHIIEEKSLLQLLVHPFIVKTHFVFQSAEKIAYVMDFLEGGELRTILCKYRFPEDTARVLTAQLALALDYLHSSEVLYRDLKPENVCLDGQGCAILLDFGVSKKGDTSVRRHTVVGSDEYMAPEMHMERPYSLAVDYWSLGLVIFEMVTGEHAFPGSGLSILRSDPVLDGVSEALKQLVGRLLLKNPTDRLHTLSALKLESFFDGLDWRGVEERQVLPSWKPPVTGLGGFDPVARSLGPDLEYSMPSDPWPSFSWGRDSFIKKREKRDSTTP